MKRSSQSLNQVIDPESARKMGFENPEPESAIYVNCIVALLAIMLVGYTFGLHGQRQSFFDVRAHLSHHSGSCPDHRSGPVTLGFIRVRQQPMIDLLQGS
jgi:hypothetical protein